MSANPISSKPASEQERGADGFDPAMVADLVRRVHHVWDDKAIGSIYTLYAHNTPVHIGDAELYGRDAVVENAVRTLATFPDLRLYGDEVIWGADGGNEIYVSHQVTLSGHHTGYGIYGPPIGRRVRRREIVHRVVRQNRVVEEWIVRDEIALIRQLGLDPVELARTVAQEEFEGGMQAPVPLYGEVPRLNGQMHPPLYPDGDPRDPDALPGLLYGLVWNARMLNYLTDLYAPDAMVWAPGNRRLEGHSDLTVYVLGLLAAFPDGAMTLDQVIWNGNEAQEYKIAARWTFQGTHRGPGIYGPPSGRRIRIMGISHFEVRAGRIQREFMVWDEFALLKQLHRPQ